MADLLKTNVQFLKETPSEPTIARDEPFNRVITYALKAGEGKNLSASISLANLTKDELSECGQVELVKMVLRFNATAGSQTFSAGVFSANGSKTPEQVSMLPGGFSITTTSFDFGAQREYEMVVPDMYSKQVQPASSMLPPFKIYVAAEKGVKVALHLYLKIHGPIVQFREYSF